MTFGFYLDTNRCTGCRACQVACKDKNRLEVGILYRKANSYVAGSFPDVKCFSYSASCNHCKDPICLKNCPTGAIYKAEDGTVIQDQSKCIGCRMCVMSCPYGHPQFFEDLGVAGKCDGCYGLRQGGNDPACVAGCPNRALHFGDIEELKAEYGDNLDNGSIAVLPDPSDTHPNVLINAKPQCFDQNCKKITW